MKSHPPTLTPCGSSAKIKPKEQTRRCPWRTTAEAILAAILLTGAGHGAPVEWTVTQAGQGHVVIDPAYANRKMATLIAQAKDYLALPTSSEKTLILNFLAGDYHFHEPNSTAMFFKDFTGGNLILKGAGSTGQGATTLIFHTVDQMGLNIVSSKGITIEGMHLTRSDLQVTQGTVENVRPGFVKFRRHTGFPSPSDLFYRNPPPPDAAFEAERTLIGFTHENPLDPHIDPSDHKVLLSEMRDLGGGLFEAKLSNSGQTPRWPVGGWVALKCKTGAPTILFKDGDDCSVKNVRVTNSSGNALRAIGSNQGMVVDGFIIDRAPAPAPYDKAPCFSSPGGGPQIYCGNEGATITNCTIIGTADDGIGYFSGDSGKLAGGGLIAGNTVRDNQARGILITQSKGGLCQYNHLIRNSDSSILIKNNEHAVATGVVNVRSWTIAFNTFTDAWVTPVISLEAEAVDGGWIGDPHTDIWIQDNTFVRAPRLNHLFSVGYADDVLIRRNTVQSFSPISDYNPNADGNSLVFVQANVPPSAWIHGGLNTTVALVPQGRLFEAKAPGVPASVVLDVGWQLTP